MSEIPEIQIVTKQISGTPIRIVSVVMAIIIILGSCIVFNNFLGFLGGVVIAIVYGIFMYGFATVVDACHTYIKSNYDNEDE